MVSRKLHSVLDRVLNGRADANVAFRDLIALLAALGFEQRQRGAHHILWKPDVVEIINRQPRGKGEALSGEAGPAYSSRVQAEIRR